MGLMSGLNGMAVGQTMLLLLLSNVFMTFAWYGHLRNLAAAPWYWAALVSFRCLPIAWVTVRPGSAWRSSR